MASNSGSFEMIAIKANGEPSQSQPSTATR
jgi:hypothetical protein